ncbi:MAG: restriction endonuclease subunit S [Gallionellaceae bacterium]|nr:restriction endonuclease subunit S [Gallionellaceae bacterium]
MSKLPTGWDVTSLESVVEILDSKRIPLNSKEREQRIAGKASHQLFPYYGATGQVGVIDGYLFDGDHILLGEDGVPFFDPLRHKAYRVRGRFWVNNHAHVLKAIDGISYYRFIEGYLNAFDYEGYISGSTRLKLTQAAMRSIPIRLAPYDEQTRIADKLDAVLARVDACRDRLDRVPATLKRFRQAVLAAATSGKLTEDWRADQVARMQPQAESGNVARDAAELRYHVTPTPDSAALHPGDRALDIGLPKTWRVCQIKNAGRIQLGRQRSPKFHTGASMRPYLRVQNVFEDRLDLSDVMKMDFPGQDIERYELHPGDILLNEGQSPEYLGRPAMYRGELPGACFTNTLIRFQAYSHVQPDFALLVFRHHMHSGRYRSEGTITTNIAHLGAGRFGNVEFPLPPLDEQSEIVRRVESLFSYADRLEARYKTARAQVEKLTPALLAKAFRGELVPQDPNDEPAAALLARIHAGRGDQTANKPKRGRKGITV